MADDRNDQPAPTVKEDPAIDSLEQRIAAARSTENARMAAEHAPMRDGRSAAIQIASTMLGYPLGGIVIGFVLDQIFDTRPWIMIVLMFLAFAGACLHVVRMNQNRAG